MGDETQGELGEDPRGQNEWGTRCVSVSVCVWARMCIHACMWSHPRSFDYLRMRVGTGEQILRER